MCELTWTIDLRNSAIIGLHRNYRDDKIIHMIIKNDKLVNETGSLKVGGKYDTPIDYGRELDEYLKNTSIYWDFWFEYNGDYPIPVMYEGIIKMSDFNDFTIGYLKNGIFTQYVAIDQDPHYYIIDDRCNVKIIVNFETSSITIDDITYTFDNINDKYNTYVDNLCNTVSDFLHMS